MTMPWYNNPVITCKVLEKIANRLSFANLQELDRTLDRATELIWSKQENYNMRNSEDKKNREPMTGNSVLLHKDGCRIR